MSFRKFSEQSFNLKTFLNLENFSEQSFQPEKVSLMSMRENYSK